MNSVLGKLTLLVLVVLAAHYHLLAAILIVFLFIAFSENVIEGMENKDEVDENDENDEKKNSEDIDENDEDSAKVSAHSLNGDFRKKNCLNGKLMKDGKDVSLDDIATTFPDIKFANNACNPCDEDCEFEIVSAEERITVEENLTPKDSNLEIVDHKKAIQKMDE
jgi:hypothetical protein